MLDSMTAQHKSRYEKYEKLNKNLTNTIESYQQKMMIITEGLERLSDLSFINKLKIKYGLSLFVTKRDLLKEVYERIRDIL